MTQDGEENEVNHAWQIRVTQILDPSNFHAQFSQDFLFEHFEAMEKELQIYCEGQEHEEVSYLEDGMTVLAFSTMMNKWLRAEVVTHDDEVQEADLIYIDYGQSEMRSWDLIISSYDAKYLTVPRMAYMCALADVQPLAKRWISRAVNYFSDLVLDIVAEADVIMMDDVSPLRARIYVKRNGESVSVADLMIAEELALPAYLIIPEPARSPAGAFDTSASPKLKTSFESLFKEDVSKSPSVDESGGKVSKPWQMDPKEKQQMVGDLQYMFGDELVKKVFNDGSSWSDDGSGEIAGDLTIEQQIRKMRNNESLSVALARRKFHSSSPLDGSRDRLNGRSPSTSRPGKRKTRRPKIETPPRTRKAPGDAAKKPNRSNRMKEELFGQRRNSKISSMIRDLDEIVSSSDPTLTSKSLDHLIMCFQCYVLDVNDFLNPEELCNDLRSFLEKCLRFPELLERFSKLIYYVKDHGTFCAAVTFALPRVVEEHTKAGILRPEPICQLLIELYKSAILWPKSERLAVHDLVLSEVGHWLDSCAKMDSEPSSVGSYCACLDLVLPSIGAHVSKTYIRKMDRYVETMRELVLSSHICRSDKETILDLLILEGRMWTEYQDISGAGSELRIRSLSNCRSKTGKTCEKRDVAIQTSASLYSGPDANAGDVTDPSSGDVGSDRHEEFVDVRLMLLELNLSQYLDDMKQCGLTDELIANHDIDLGSLMLDFEIPGVVTKRILLHLGRDLPDKLYTKISQQEKEKKYPPKSDWEEYCSKLVVSKRHVSQFGDFVPEKRKLSFDADEVEFVAVKVESKEGKASIIALDDEESFPPLNGVDLVAPPRVTRLTEKVDVTPGNTKGDYLRMSDLARAIIDSAGSVTKNSDTDSNRRNSSGSTVDTDENRRRKNSPYQKTDPSDQNVDTLEGHVSALALNEDAQSSDSSGEIRPKEDGDNDETAESAKRIDLVALCHKTVDLDFKFKDGDTEQEVVNIGLNAVTDLITGSQKNSPVTRGFRVSSRPDSADSKSRSSPCPDWVDEEFAEQTLWAKEDKGKASYRLTPTCWLDISTGESPEFEGDVFDDEAATIGDMIAAVEADELIAKSHRRPQPTSFKSSTVVCTNCGSKEHGYDHCPFEKRLILY